MNLETGIVVIASVVLTLGSGALLYRDRTARKRKASPLPVSADHRKGVKPLVNNEEKDEKP